jgi:hypothetical protein
MDKKPWRNTVPVITTQGFAAAEYHKKMKQQLARLRNDEFWNERVVRSKRLISLGRTLYEVQEELGLADNEQYWETIKYALALTYYDRSNTMIEWSVKHQIRYKMLIDVYEKAKSVTKRKLVHNGKKKEWREVNEPNLKLMLDALKQMNELDKTDIMLKQMLGIIAPVHDSETNGEGYLSDGHQVARDNGPLVAKLRGLISTVEQSVRDVAPDLLDVSEPGRESDNVGPTVLDESDSGGRVEGNQDS